MAWRGRVNDLPEQCEWFGGVVDHFGEFPKYLGGEIGLFRLMCCHQAQKMIKYVCYAIIKTQGDKIRMFNTQGSKIAVGVNKLKKKCTREMFASYGITAAVTLLIMILVKGSYALTSFRYYPFMLSNASVCYAVLASVLMQGYIRNTRQFSINNHVLRCLMAVSYGLSGFFVTQENTWSTCVIGVALPVLVLLLEDVIDGVRYIPFVVLGAILLSVDSLIAVPVMILLFLYAIADKSGKDHFTLGDFITYLATFLFSALIGSWRIVFQYIVRWMEHGDYAYPGFKSFYGGSAFLSRILPGSVSAYTFLGTNQKMDAYVSLLVVMGIMLFVFHSQISLRKRIAYAIYLVISAILVVTTAGYYVLHLFTYDDTVTLGYSVVLVFFMIRMTMEALAQVDNIRRSTWIKAVVGTLLVFAGAWSFSAHNFHAYAGTLQILGIIILVVGLAGSRKNRRLFGAVLFVCCVVEIAGQTWISVNRIDVVKNAQNVQVISDNYGSLFVGSLIQTPEVTIKDNKVDIIQKQSHEEKKSNAQIYSEFIEKYRATDMEECIAQLFNAVSMSSKELIKITGKDFPNLFEKVNAYARKLGVNDTVFREEKLDIKFTGENAKRVTDIGNQIYAVDYVDGKEYPDGSLITYEIFSKKNIYVLSDADNTMIHINGQKGNTTGYFYLDTVNPLVYNIDFLAYSLNKDSYEEMVTKIGDRSELKDSNNYIIYDYVGVGLSYLGVMLLIFYCFYNNADEIIHKIRRNLFCQKLKKLCDSLEKWILDNKVYLVAFFGPVIVWTIALIVKNCAPFGEKCILDSDGISLIIPTITDNWFQFHQTGNEALSMNLGYGFNLGVYYTYHILGKIYALLPYKSIVGGISVQIVISMGCIGWSVVYYMSHRKLHQTVKKSDWYILVPVCVYTFCSYMLAMRIYPTWLIIYALFPILLVKMDELILENKWFCYIILLGFCIFFEIQLSLFICIYLFIRFFTYHYRNFKDFFVKGIYFGVSSIFAAGCGFFTISRTVQAYQNSYYQSKDSVFSGVGFYSNFLNQWKDFLPFSNIAAVSERNETIVGYIGISTLIMVAFWAIDNNEGWKNKIRRLIPILILLISFNEKLLTYIWNGFHYQALVPNRYYFIFAFLISEIAYDEIIKLNVNSMSRKYFVLGGIFGLITIIFGLQNNPMKWIEFGMSCLIILAILLKLCFGNKSSDSMRRCVFYCLILEMTLNFTYAMKQYNEYDLIKIYGDVKDYDTAYSGLKIKGDIIRSVELPSVNFNLNFGQYCNIGSVGAFNSYIDYYQMLTNKQYGFSNGANNLSTNYCTTYASSALAHINYYRLPALSNNAMGNIDQYKYLGKYGDYYIYKNEDVCSLGYYIPPNILINESSGLANDLMINKLSNYKQQKNIYSIQNIGLNDSQDGFSYYDWQDNKLSVKEVMARRNGVEEDNIVKIHIRLKARTTGEAYIYMDQMVYLGHVKKGEYKEFTINYPDDAIHMRPNYSVYISKLNDEKNFLLTIRKNQLENVTIKEDNIIATSDYEEDGYTMFSLAYSKNWHAFVDDKPTKVYCYNNSNMYIKTPKAKHRVILKYIPYHYKLYRAISFGCLFAVIFTKLIQEMVLKKRRKKGVLEIQQKFL